MDTNNFFTIFLIIFILSLIIYWNTNIYQNDKFKVMLSLFTAFSFVMTTSVIIFQIKNYNESEIYKQVESFTSLIKDFLDGNIQEFIQHPEMNYYYNQLLGLNYEVQQEKRNIFLENQISMLIFSRMASVIYYIQRFQDNPNYSKETKILESRFLNIVDTFSKSSIFMENWEVYKEKLSGVPIRVYLNKKLNI